MFDYKDRDVIPDLETMSNNPVKNQTTIELRKTIGLLS
jgi:hypothetical protein